MSVPVLATENISVYVNNQKVDYDVQPQTINGRVMVPMRATFSALGADVIYYEDLGVITAQKNNEQIIMLLGQKRIAVIDVSIDKTKKFVESDVAPTVIDGRTLVPLRAVSDCFDCNIIWNNQTKSVAITCDENLMTIRKSTSNKDLIKFNIVTDGVSKDITAVANARMIGYDIMVEAKPVLEELGALVVWNEETKTLEAYRKDKGGCTMKIKYDGSNILQQEFNDGATITKMQATVTPKLVDGIPMIYYHDVAILIGGVSHYVADTKTCTIVEGIESQTSDEISNTYLNDDNGKNNAYTENAPVTTKNSKNNLNEKKQNQPKIQQTTTNKDTIVQDRDTSVKSTKVLKKDEGWVYVTNEEVSQKTNSEQKHKVLRAGEGWVYE